MDLSGNCFEGGINIRNVSVSFDDPEVTFSPELLRHVEAHGFTLRAAMRVQLVVEMENGVFMNDVVMIARRSVPRTREPDNLIEGMDPSFMNYWACNDPRESWGAAFVNRLIGEHQGDLPGGWNERVFKDIEECDSHARQ